MGPESPPLFSTGVLATLVLLFTLFFFKWFNATTHQLKHIPTIGRPGVISSYVDAFRFFAHGHTMIQEGYKRYYGSAFKVPTLFKWIVIVSGPPLIDEIRRAADEHLSFDEFVAETLQMEHTLDPDMRRNTYHIGVIRTPLTKNIAPCLPAITDEIAEAFKALVPANGNQWTSVPALKTMSKLICRTTNRYLVGLPLCRNADYTDLIEKFTLDIYLGGQIISLFPELLKSFAARSLTKVPGDIKRCVAHLRPLIESEMQKEGQNEKSDNVIQWLLAEAQDKGIQPSVQDIAIRVLAINFVAIHTASNALTHALYYLAANPQYAEPMRQEAQTITDSEGLTKDSLAQMHNIDSFIKESQRLSMGAVAISRKVMSDFTFSDGLHLPKGTEVAIATFATHTDERNYDDPLTFKPWRFCQEGELKQGDLVSPSPTYLSFGSGRHACPGRFFASTELKATFAHILLNYDVKLLQDGSLPPENVWYQGAVIPNTTAHVMFRRRAE